MDRPQFDTLTMRQKEVYCQAVDEAIRRWKLFRKPIKVNVTIYEKDTFRPLCYVVLDEKGEVEKWKLLV